MKEASLQSRSGEGEDTTRREKSIRDREEAWTTGPFIMAIQREINANEWEGLCDVAIRK